MWLNVLVSQGSGNAYICIVIHKTYILLKKTYIFSYFLNCSYDQEIIFIMTTTRIFILKKVIYGQH